MATQKRHVLYFSDEEWTDVKARAAMLDMTASAYIRSSVIGGHVTPIRLQRELARAIGQTEDDLAQKLKLPADQAVRFNTQPFRGPIPKKR